MINSYANSLETEVLSASPVELIRMLYKAALDSISDARSYLTEGDIHHRSTAITKASAIVLELSASLDHSRGGEISGRLAALYEYVHYCLTTANIEQSDRLLAEALDILTTISKAWEATFAPEEFADAAAPVWAPMPVGTAFQQNWTL